MNPPRPRSWLRRLLWLAAFVIASGLLLKSELASRIAARTAEPGVEQLTGEDVTIAGMDVSYWPPEVAMRGLVIADRTTGDTIAAATRISVRGGFAGFRPALTRVTVERPLVELHLDPDGLREFRDRLSPPDRARRAMAERFPWEELVVEDGRFLLHGDGWDVEVDDIDLAGAPEATLGLGRVRLAAGRIEQSARDVRIAGIRASPRSIAIPKLAIDFHAFGVEGAVAADLYGELRGDLSVWLDAGRLTGALGDANWTDGVVDVDVSLAGTLEDPQVEGALRAVGLTLWKVDANGPHPTRFGDTWGRWHLDRRTAPALVLDEAHMAWGEGQVGVQARLGFEPPTLEAGVTAESVRLARILQAVSVAPTPWVDFRADIEAHVSGTWSPLSLNGPFEVDLDGLAVGDAPVDGPHDTLLSVPRGDVGGQLIITADRMVLDARTVRAGRTRGRALADIGFGPTGPLAIDVDLPRLDLSWLQPLGDLGLAGMGSLQGRLWGPTDALAAEGHLEVEGAVILGLPIADTLSADLGTDMRRLWFTGVRGLRGDTAYEGAYAIDFTRDNFMDTQIRVADGRLRDLVGVFVDLGDADGAVTGTLSLSGTPYHLSGDASFQLSEVDLYGERFPRGTAVGWMDDGEFTLGELALRRGGASLAARGTVGRGYRMNMEVVGDGFRLEDLDWIRPLELPVQGNLRVDARVGGTLYEWEPRGRLAATATYFRGEALGDSNLVFDTRAGTIQYEGGLFGDAAVLQGTLGMYGDQPYRLAADLTRFPAHLVYPRGADGTPITATVTGELELGGRFGDSPTPVDVTGRFDAVSVTWRNHELRNPAPWRFSVRDRSVDVPDLGLVGADGTALRFEGWAGAGGRIGFRGDGQLDLDLARAFVPGLTEARGMGIVAFDWARTPGQPAALRASLDLDGATLRSEYFPHAFEDVYARLVATPDAYTLTDLRAVMGGGTVTSERSTIEAEGWVPRRYALAATVRDARVRYLDYLPPLVGDAELSFDGPVEDLLLSGAIDIRDMEFSERVDWEAMVLSLSEETLTAAAPEESEKYFAMDLQVRADSTVRLRNNVADAEASADLRIVGDTARPGMTGQIRVDPGGRMYLHEREFDVTRAELRYIDPYTYDPDLDLLLETDVQSHDQQYHVSYSVTGPFSDWRSTTSSDPSLSQADVNALLLFGYTREELERYGGLQAALVAETGDLLFGQSAFLQKNPFLSTLVDRWSLVSGVSERGASTVSSDLRLVAEKAWQGFDFTLETTVTGGFGQDYYVSVERRLAERMYATAYLATQQEGRSLPIGAAYGTEFRLRWEWE